METRYIVRKCRLGCWIMWSRTDFTEGYVMFAKVAHVETFGEILELINGVSLYV